jgi:hypothetical protein
MLVINPDSNIVIVALTNNADIGDMVGLRLMDVLRLKK